MNGWISVKERLPEEEGDYLVFYKKGNEDCVDIALFTKRYGWWHEAQITHWQPLPEPPKEGE